MMASYAAAYGGPPAPSSPWPLFLALVARAPRIDAQAQLRFYDAVVGGIAAALAPGVGTKAERDALVARAYELRKAPIVFHENMFRPDYRGPADA